MTFAPPSPKFIPARHHGGAQTPTLIVVHATVGPTTAGAALGVARMWNGPGSPVSSAHYVTDTATTYQCVGDHTVAYHCGHNDDSLGLEMCFMPLANSLANWLLPKSARKGRRDSYQHGKVIPLRWLNPTVSSMMVRNANLQAQLHLAYGIPVRYLGVEEVKAWDAAGRPAHLGGYTTHAVMSEAFHQSTHWDPGTWPQRLYDRTLRRQVRALRKGAEPTPTPAPGSTDTLNVLAWNVKTGNPAAKHTIENLLELHKPDVAVFMECQPLAVDFKEIEATSGYTVLRERVASGWYHEPMDERGETVVLLAPGVTASYDKVRVMGQRWVGPVHRNEHTGRRYRMLRLKAHGKTWRLCAAHWPTGWSHAKNTSAVQETLRFSRAWMGRGLRAPSVIVGDLNAGAGKLRPMFPKQTVTGTGPDNLIAGKADVTMEKLGRYGSDHHAVLYCLEAK